jgi:hypothetical protein
VISLLFSALWGVIRSERDLLKSEVSEQEINAILIRTTPNLGFYLGVIVLAIFAPRVAAFGYLVIAVVGVFRAHGDERTPPEMAEPT